VRASQQIIETAQLDVGLCVLTAPKAKAKAILAKRDGT